MPDPTSALPMGTIVAFALDSTQIPDGWLLCDGSSIPAQYQEFITALGSPTTPALCGRTLIGAGTPPPSETVQSDGFWPNFGGSVFWAPGDTGGEYQHYLSLDEMPSHAHSINGGDFGIHSKSFEGGGGSDYPFESDASSVLSGTDSAGANAPHYNMQPYYAVNYIIYTGQ